MEFSVRLPPPVPFPSNIKAAPLVHVSLQKLQSGDSEESARVFEACKKAGFFLLDLQNVPAGEALMDDADAIMGLSDELFALKLEEKQKYAYKMDVSGYKGVGMIRVDRTGTPDRCEFFGVLKDELLGISPVLDQPDLIKRHRELFASFTRRAHEVAMAILAQLDASLHLAPGTLESLHRLSEASGDLSRFLRFDPQPAGDRRTSFLPHTDLGSITILFNVLGGLQILPESQITRPSGNSVPDINDPSAWQFIRPVPGCAIVNIGDALVKLTNGLLTSVLHRVTYAPGDQGDLVRNALGYFVRPETKVVKKKVDLGNGVIPYKRGSY